MSAVKQMPRACIIWLLIAQTAVMLPHIPRLSWWMIAIWLLCAAWRLAMFRGEAAYPSFLLRVVVVSLGSVGIAISFGEQGALDVAVAALIFAFSLKLIEVKKRRDLYLVFYLAFFVIAASFLYSQSLFLVLYQIFAVLLVFTGLVATQQASAALSPSHAVRVSAVALGQAIPFLVLMFFLFPRIGPIWSVSESTVGSTTGMSDSMAPGDVSNLSRSTAMAFTVDLKGTPLAQDQLYWRGITYEDFDGREWSKGQSSRPAVETTGALRATMQKLPVQLRSTPIDYEITLNGHGAQWLFALPMAEIRPSGGYKMSGIAALNDFNYRTLEPLQGISIWKVRSSLDFVAEPVMSEQRFKYLTALPKGYNPQTVSMARNMARNSNGSHELVNQLIGLFSSQEYFYSLQPARLGRDSVDDFLFESKVGFCEHYASAATVLLRAAGIPARIVAGYQGGERNPINGTVIVRQQDAHAWTEYWVAGQGWTRFDPTAAVSPDRVLRGLDAALASSEGQGIGQTFYQIGFFKGVRQRLDALNYAWQRAFIGFDYKAQESLLQRWIGEINIRKMLILAIALSTISLTLLAAFTLLRGSRKRLSAEDQLYSDFCQKLAHVGLIRHVTEPPATFALRVAESRPELADETHQITRLYQQIVFQGLRQKSIQNQLAKLVKGFSAKSRSSQAAKVLPFTKN